MVKKFDQEELDKEMINVKKNKIINSGEEKTAKKGNEEKEKEVKPKKEKIKNKVRLDATSSEEEERR